MPANPLMLTILCVVHHQDRNLPRRRARLYAKCVRVLVEHWRKEVLENQGVAGFDPEAAEGVLSSVAWWLHEKEDRTSQTVEELGAVAGKALVDLAPGANLGATAWSSSSGCATTAASWRVERGPVRLPSPDVSEPRRPLRGEREPGGGAGPACRPELVARGHPRGGGGGLAGLRPEVLHCAASDRRRRRRRARSWTNAWMRRATP